MHKIENQDGHQNIKKAFRTSKFFYTAVVICLCFISYGTYSLFFRSIEVYEVKSKDLNENIKKGLSAQVNEGREVVFNYDLYLFDSKRSDHKGRFIDSTFQRKLPQKIILGQRQTVKGVEKALLGRKAGDHIWVRVPAHLGYGVSDYGLLGALPSVGVPRGRDLFYHIEVKAVN